MARPTEAPRTTRRRMVIKKVKRPSTIIELLSPTTFAIFTACALCFTAIDNPIGWASNFPDVRGITPSIGATYLAAFLISLSLLNTFLRIKRGVAASAASKPLCSRALFINEQMVLLIFLMAVAFQLAKFVNIGSIPLLGNPLDRYKLTLGGFEDYPSRLMAPLASALFCLNILQQRKRRLTRMLMVCVGVLLNLLMTQRQELANLVFGCCLLWAFNRRAKAVQLISLLLVTFCFAYVLIGLGAILRYGGAENISSNVSTLMLPIWIVHAEITMPYMFGEHVVNALNGAILYGLYTFGEFIAIFSSSKIAHGASLMQGLFTDRDTAQSVGAPYSYFIDFGYSGLIVVAFINSAIMGWYYRKLLLNRTSSYWMTAYSVVFLSSFWSIRSGISLFYPLIIYILAALFCVTSGGSRSTATVRSIVRFMFALSLLVSLGALLFRR